MARVSREPGSCPTHDCGGGYRNRQVSLVSKEIPELEGVGITAVESLMRCTYCGCVYRLGDYRNGNIVETEILGYLDSMFGTGWHPTDGTGGSITLERDALTRLKGLSH